ncbi:MAG: peptidoglycan DD-metalloendopeptidase family protein [Gammaproteobacteria bacterium]|nr:peptidoglycan DD-metalloendopeptidase family protein [Gammaproteobacteria bacterium]MBU2435928.1 peptidoglycan DD-metalloendopeptidase family protein [Gammaproteobacteria bacterium]MBU2449290.1 peptidoglycan DD-metalloendopeptidase family protein [Gammaproteobacteria bacterium]
MIRIVTTVFPLLFLAGCMSQLPAPAVDRSSTAGRSVNQPVGPGYYIVKRGDTLYRIALEHGQDHRDVAMWNNITNSAAIKEGQVLRIAPPVAAAETGTDGAVAKPIELGAGVESRALDQASSSPDVAAPSGALKREPRVGKEPYSDEAYARLNKVGGETVKPAAVQAEVKAEAAPAAPAGPDDVAWMWPTSVKLSAPYSDGGNKGLDFAGKAGDPILAASNGKVVYAGSGLRGFGELVIIKHNATYLSAYAHNRKILVKEGQQVSRGQKIAEMGNTDADAVKLHFEIRKQGKPVDPALYLPKR